MQAKNTICLWYDGTALEAARFYAETFPDSAVGAVMRAPGRNVWIVGGGDLAGQFHDAGLLDEVILQVGSVTLGAGKPLFPRRVTSPPWTLVSVRQIGPGFAELHYRIPTSRAAHAA